MIETHIIPCLSDNYAYIVENQETKEAILIDACEAEAINQLLSSLDAKLIAVLFTHHDYDHIDGLAGLDTQDALVIGARADAHRLPPLDRQVVDGEWLELAGIPIQVLDVPGHTIGHVAYIMPSLNAAFTGDSLMSWGCGRLFEGTPHQMFQTLSRLNELPAQTSLYSGHNYGVSNGEFALSLEPDHPDLLTRMQKIQAQNQSGEPIMPITLAEEQKTNPFLRCHDDEFAAKLGIAALSPADRFAHIRKLKDEF